MTEGQKIAADAEAGVPLSAIAKLIRSKNAGPFWVTFDIMFDSDEDLERVVAAGVLTKPWVAETYGVAVEDVILVAHRPARALKFSFPRPRPQGDVGERDMYSGQQYAPVMALRAL